MPRQRRIWVPRELTGHAFLGLHNPVPVQVRMLRIARRLYEGKTITSHWIQRTFSVHKATAERDMRIIQCYLPVEHLPPKMRPHSAGGKLTYKIFRLASPRT